jgi:hypothetical protein
MGLCIVLPPKGLHCIHEYKKEVPCASFLDCVDIVGDVMQIVHEKDTARRPTVLNGYFHLTKSCEKWSGEQLL